jgi:hypothetical protein
LRKTIFKKLEAQGLIANYNRLRKNLPPRLPERVFIWDETLREGVQTPTVFLTYVEKVKLAKMLDEIGVSIMSVGHPGLKKKRTGSKESPMKAFSKPVLQLLQGYKKVMLMRASNVELEKYQYTQPSTELIFNTS